jgi:hypothetical protein
MKFCTVFLVSVVLSISLSSPVFADEEWQEELKENMNSAMLFSHSLYASDVTCRINIMKDETITGYSIYHSQSGEVIVDSITLKIKDGEKVLERELSHYAPNDRFSIEGGYPVFEEKCITRIRSLPPEIQERLKGWFEIE